MPYGAEFFLQLVIQSIALYSMQRDFILSEILEL